MHERSNNIGTWRERMWQSYEDNDAPFEVNTKPYHSTVQLVGDVVDVDATNQFGFLVFRPQVLTFFNYGVGDRVSFGPVQRAANDADTNLAKGKSTNGAADIVIEGIGAHFRAARVRDAAVEDAPQQPFLSAAPPTDPCVISMAAGESPLIDPGSIFAPPQVHSPFNLENIFVNMLPFMSLEIEFDRRRTEKLGALDVMPQGGAASLLRSNGVPSVENRYCVREGLVWRRDGQPDSEMIARVRLEECIVVPLVFNDDPATGADTVVPSNVYLDMVVRLYGQEFELPSGN